MEQRKSILYQAAFLTLKRGFLVLAAVLVAGSLIALALLDDIKLADKTVRDMEVVSLTDGAPADAALFAESKLTVLNVWATFCGPCIREMPEFAEVSHEYAARGVRFIGVCGDIKYDESGEPNQQLIDDAFTIIETTGADYAHYMPTPAYKSALSALVSDSYPGTFLVDRDGNIKKLFVGALTKDTLTAAIDKELAAIDGAQAETEALS